MKLIEIVFRRHILLFVLFTVWKYSTCTDGLFLNWRLIEEAINQLNEFTSRSSRSTNYAAATTHVGGTPSAFDYNAADSSNSVFTSTKPSGAAPSLPNTVQDDDDLFGDQGTGGANGMPPEDMDSGAVEDLGTDSESGSGVGSVPGSGSGENSFLEQIPSNQIKCYDELGCIEITDEWFDILNRPLNLLPLDRHKIHTRFILYTRRRVTDPIEVHLNRTSLLEAGFQPQLPVKFVIHGFIDTGFSSWVVKLSQQLTTHSDVNVFAVDWGGGSLSFYTQATANTRVVGLELAHFVKFLMNEFNVQPKDIHLIGHSLGSHISGYAGQKIAGLGRITGLDPAEPYFQNMPPFVRLDPTDAAFVDVIHTDGRTILLGGYGMIQPCGHVDFYPNNGKEQPGCDLAKNPMNLINAHGLDQVQREIFACNHHRAIYYFIESLLTTCPFVAHRCPDYDTYLMGKCHSCGSDGSLCAKMGIESDKYDVGNRSLVRFYLSTAKSIPYCVYHYRINLQLAYPRHAAPWVTGKVKMTLKGTEMTIRNINLTPSENLRVQHGTNLTFMIQNSKPIGALVDVQVEWKYNNNYLDVMAQCWRFLCNNKLFVKRVEVTDIDALEDDRESEESLFRDAMQNRTESESEYIVPSTNANLTYLTVSRSVSLRTYALCGEIGNKYTGIASGGHATFDRAC